MHLRNLYLGDNLCNPLPNLKDLVALEFLILDANELSDISNLEFLPQLTDLYLASNKLKWTGIDGGKILAGLDRLETLDLRSNRIQSLKNLAPLPALSTLKLDGNRLIDLNGLEFLSTIEILSASENNISDVTGLVQLHRVQWELNLFDNEIASLIGLEKLADIRGATVNLNNNRIVNLSPLAAAFQSEGRINLQNNRVEHFPANLGSHLLAQVNLRENRIKDLSGLASVKSIKDLDLSFNQIREIPNLTKLEKIDRLRLCGNQIVDVVALASVDKIDWLDLSFNRISNYEQFKQLKDVRVLDLSGNVPLTDLGIIEHLSVEYLYITVQTEELKEELQRSARFSVYAYLPGEERPGCD